MKNLTIIYDNKCSLCISWVSFIYKNKDQRCEIDCIPVRSIEAKNLLKDNGIQFIDLNTIYAIRNKVVYKKSTAIFIILSFSKMPYKLFSNFKYLPMRLTDFLYTQFAKRRFIISKLVKSIFK